MNRSILIVICDFLLLSLLTFSTDFSHIADEETHRSARVEMVTNAVPEPAKDLTAVMKLALEEEQKSHEQLVQQLASVRDAADRQQMTLAEREKENERLHQQFASAQSNLQQLNLTVQTNTAERQALEKQLQSQFAAAQANIEALNRQLQINAAQAQVSEAQLAATQADAQKKADLAAALREQLDDLGKSNQVVTAEKQRLTSQLAVAEVERRAAAERATLMQQEVQATRIENAKLAEGFKSLASDSSKLAEEIRQSHAQTPNSIFSEFVSNRLEAVITASRPGFLGLGGDRPAKTKMILVTDGTNSFALCHVQDTPLTLFDPGTDWDGLRGMLFSRRAQATIRAISFDRQDPRIVMLPISPSEAAELDTRAFRVSPDPFKFQEAVLVGANDGYYGECNFQIDLDTPNYLKLDRNVLKGLFGKFNPSRGDLVFSRSGELLGIMANNSYCLTLNSFAASATIPFNQDLRIQHTGDTLAQLYHYVAQLPLRLQ